MLDDFDFEDDLGSLKGEDEQNDNSFFPPVNNTSSKANLNEKTNSRLSKINDNKLPSAVDNKGKFEEKPVYPKASSKMGMANQKKDEFGFGDDIDDEYGFEQVKPKVDTKKSEYLPSSISNVRPNAKIIDVDSQENDDDYANDFDDYAADSVVGKSNRPETKPPIVPKNGRKDPFESPVPSNPKADGISNQIDDKVRGIPSNNINIQDMRRLNSKLNKGSDLDDYSDDDYKIGDSKRGSIEVSSKRNSKPVETKPLKVNQMKPKPASPKEPVKKDSKIDEPTPRTKQVIENREKPITIKTGPITDPEPIRQNLRLDTEQKNRMKPTKLHDAEVNKLSTRGLGEVSESEQEATERDNKKDAKTGGQVFLTQNKEDSDDNYDSDSDVDKEPPKMAEPPKAKKAPVQVQDYADEDVDALTKENEALISQLLEFTNQMDDRMDLLKKFKKVDKELDSNRPDSALQSRKARLDNMARKMKLIKTDIENMNRILDNSYKVDSVVDKENRFKEQEK